mmetsp:Transcript_17613/g.53704  ORF Transcript_17613/g.53704 Transcript_17613/m.53704 type:complete len:206 (-) Transcript_17613:289-906(-)
MVPSYWEERWAGGLEPGTAWDVAAPSPCLRAVLARLPVGETLVPGAGRAYDAVLLAKERPVTAVDISETACAEAQKYVDALEDKPETLRILHDDFFTFRGGPYALVWDCTFLCALPPAKRDAWARRTSDLVADDGVICTLIFPIGKDDDQGPPWALSYDLVESLLGGVGFAATDVFELPVGTHLPRAPWGNTVALWKRPPPRDGS